MISMIIFSASCLISDKAPFSENDFFKNLKTNIQSIKFITKITIAKIIIFYPKTSKFLPKEGSFITSKTTSGACS